MIRKRRVLDGAVPQIISRNDPLGSLPPITTTRVSERRIGNREGRGIGNATSRLVALVTTKGGLLPRLSATLLQAVNGESDRRRIQRQKP